MDLQAYARYVGLEFPPPAVRATSSQWLEVADAERRPASLSGAPRKGQRRGDLLRHVSTQPWPCMCTCWDCSFTARLGLALSRQHLAPLHHRRRILLSKSRDQPAGSPPAWEREGRRNPAAKGQATRHPWFVHGFVTRRGTLPCSLEVGDVGVQLAAASCAGCLPQRASREACICARRGSRQQPSRLPGHSRSRSIQLYLQPGTSPRAQLPNPAPQGAWAVKRSLCSWQ